MQTIDSMVLSGKKVLIRVDFNVPLDANQNITDDARIRAVLPTIELARRQDAKVILASHLGRPNGEVVAEFSLAPVAKCLETLLACRVTLAPDCIGPQVEAMVEAMQPSEIVLLENLRFHKGEQRNDETFAKTLAQLCDIYINDAFAVSHRVNASVVGITQFSKDSGAGLLLQRELDYFQKAMQSPQRPLAAVIGGAKVSSKLGALQNLLDKVDRLIIGGAMANTFLKSMGHAVGRSKVELELIEAAAKVLRTAADSQVKCYLPIDAVVADRFSADAAHKIVSTQQIPSEWMVLDIGPATSRLYAEALADAATILWNGPMGVFEMEAFSKGTLAMVDALTQGTAMTIVGGGDTDAALHLAGKADRVTYISTGGGAFLALLEGKTLPGVAALQTPV
jgi:phosphoglycerate kinase